VKVLVDGCGNGQLEVLSAPLSFWGGVDPVSGAIIDPNHPEAGRILTGKIIVLPHGRGSSSSATVLAEMTRTGTGPVGVILEEPDGILVTGAYIANELYGTSLVVTVGVSPEDTSGLFRLDGSGLHRLGSEEDASRGL
jgi:uncharacterized protein